MTAPARRALLLALNLVAFQLAWFACAVGAARGTPVVGIAAVAGAVGLQLVVSDARSRDAVLLAVAVAMGLGWDTIMMRLHVVAYASPGPFEGWAPAWILALWALFATTLRGPLRWVHGRWWLAALLGGIGGPLSYWGAVRLGAGEFADFRLAMVVLAGGWAVMTPCLTELARSLNRSGRPARALSASPPAGPPGSPAAPGWDRWT